MTITNLAEAVDEMLEDLGGLGKFQILVIWALIMHKISAGWSMLQMSYAGMIPDWHCLAPGVGSFNVTNHSNDTLNQCMVNTSLSGQMTSCSQYDFLGSSLTIINEWDLVCDLKWVKNVVTSTQMAGVMVGSFVSGQLADYLGRKKTLYGFVLQHMLTNLIAAFSVSWIMFVICRFFIGVGIGAILVSSFPYPLEFLPRRWRPILPVIPVFVMGVALFSLSAMFLQNWSHLHIGCAACALPGLLGYFYVPESMRWLTVQGRLKEAEAVVAKIAAVNNRPIPKKTKEILQLIAEDAMQSRENDKKYSYIDIFRGRETAKITFIFCFQWLSMSIIYYGISFGVSSLAGNIYLNIFLLAVVETPALASTYYFNKKIGRRLTTIALHVISTAAAFACLAVYFTVSEEKSGSIITWLSLTAKMGIGAAWGVLQFWGTELYPTVTRNIGYGACNAAARVGGILAPYLVNFDDMVAGSYVIIGCLLLISIVLDFITPETKGMHLSDTLVVKGDKLATHKHGEKLNQTGERIQLDDMTSRDEEASQPNGIRDKGSVGILSTSHLTDETKDIHQEGVPPVKEKNPEIFHMQENETNPGEPPSYVSVAKSGDETLDNLQEEDMTVAYSRDLVDSNQTFTRVVGENGKKNTALDSDVTGIATRL